MSWHKFTPKNIWAGFKLCLIILLIISIGANTISGNLTLCIYDIDLKTLNKNTVINTSPGIFKPIECMYKSFGYGATYVGLFLSAWFIDMIIILGIWSIGNYIYLNYIKTHPKYHEAYSEVDIEDDLDI